MLTGKVNWKPVYYMLLILLAGALLSLGRAVFIPLSFAFLISFILYPVCKWLELKGTGRPVAIFISLIILLAFGSLIVILLVSQVLSFSSEWPLLKEKLLQAFRNLSVYITNTFNISEQRQNEWLEDAIKNASSQMPSLLKDILYSSGASLFVLLIVPVFAALILYSRQSLVEATCSLFAPDKRDKVLLIIRQTVTTYYNFIKGMVLVYLIVGILNSVGLLLLGVPHAILFGFIAAILTIFPYVGIIAGSILPIAVSWIEYNSVWHPIGVIAVFSVVQYLESNVIFPLAVSNRLRISALSTLTAIIAGGIIWGGAGMILFIPFLGILKVIADNTNMQVLSKFLGGRE